MQSPSPLHLILYISFPFNLLPLHSTLLPFLSSCCPSSSFCPSLRAGAFHPLFLLNPSLFTFSGHLHVFFFSFSLLNLSCLLFNPVRRRCQDVVALFYSIFSFNCLLFFVPSSSLLRLNSHLQQSYSEEEKHHCLLSFATNACSVFDG